jgi:DNA-binding LacI/PurR family transcriptional regulator
MRAREGSVTIKDIAQRLGLSKSTVSYALNNGPRQVSPEVRARVLSEANNLGFRPNPVALSLATRRTKTIGFVPSSLEAEAMTIPLAHVALQAIYCAAHETEMHVLLPSGFVPERSQETWENLLSAPIDGLILLLPENAQAMAALKARGVPMIAMICPPEGVVPTINADNVGGIRYAVDHLASLGHQRIAVLYDDSHYDTAIRFQALTSALPAIPSQLGFPLFRQSGLTEVSGHLAATRLFSEGHRPSAILAVNDHVASGCVRAALAAGLRVPDDVSIIGFDDDLIGRNCVIPMTTIRQPIPEMAHASFLGILEQLEGTPVPDQVLPCHLVVRHTTAPPSKP